LKKRRLLIGSNNNNLKTVSTNLKSGDKTERRSSKCTGQVPSGRPLAGGGSQLISDHTEVEVEVNIESQDHIYIVGKKKTGGPIPASDVIRSSYKPNITREIIRSLIQIRDENPEEKLFLLGPKYDDREGGDIQFGVSETSHKRESAIDNALRGVEEELQIKLSPSLLECSLVLEYKKNRLSHSHWVAKISSDSDYTCPKKEDIKPNPSKDNKAQKASVYLYGTKEELLKILKNFIPFTYVADKTKRIHDPISDLAMIPFDDLESFL
jgi:hypothetical protein